MDGTLADRRIRQISLQQLGRGLRNVMATLFTSPSD
jgi:hypothetical protein